MSKSYRRDVLLGKIYSEGYCCLWGYFTFCQAKGQGTRSISEWHGISIDAVRHHFRRMRAGDYSCQAITTCIKPDIEAISQTKESP